MKLQIIKLLSMLSLFLLFSNAIQAQTETEPFESFQSKYTFEGEGFEKDVILRITKESKYFRLNVNGKVEGGNASATLHTKSGRRICGLRLKAKDGSRAKGTMGEELEVRDGTYILKIRNNAGQGYLEVDFSQH